MEVYGQYDTKSVIIKLEWTCITVTSKNRPNKTFEISYSDIIEVKKSEGFLQNSTKIKTSTNTYEFQLVKDELTENFLNEIQKSLIKFNNINEAYSNSDEVNKYVKAFTKKAKYSYNIEDIDKFRDLLIFKGNKFTKNQIRLLIGDELENQDYEDFKLKIIPNQSNDFDNYVINFIEEFGDNYIEYIGFFSELLIEKGFSIPDDEIESKIEEIKKHSELIDLENSILNFDENFLEDSNKNKFNPEESKIWFNKGNIYYDIDNPDEAIWCYDNALELNPSNISALNMKGLVLHKLGKINAAAACYNKALHISSNNAETWNNMGVLLFDIKQKEKAAICYNIASKVDNNAKTFSNLNKSLKILGKAPGIISKYQSFMETSTSDPSVLFESIDPSTIVDADPSDTIDSLSQLFQ